MFQGLWDLVSVLHQVLHKYFEAFVLTFLVYRSTDINEWGIKYTALCMNLLNANQPLIQIWFNL